MSDSPASKRRFGWRVGVAVAVVGLASAGAIGIAAATSGQPSAEPAPAAEEHDGPPWAGHGWGGDHWGGGGPFGLFEAFGDMDIADLSHAEVVLAKDGGGAQTVLVQKGAVTSVDDGSIAVKSADGYARTYSVTAATKVNGDEKIDSVAKDEEVVVVSKDGGDTPAATIVVDLTDLGWN